MKKIPTLTVTNEGVSFRHPTAKASDGYGKKVNETFKRLDIEEKRQIEDGLRFLIELQPMSYEEIKGKTLHPKAILWYFKPMKDGKRVDELLAKAEAATAKAKDLQNIYNEHYFLIREAELLATIEEKEGKILAQQLQIESLLKELGKQSVELQALSLEDAFTHFKSHYKASTEATTDSVCSNVSFFIESIGSTTKIASVKLQDIQKTLEGHKNIVKRSKAVKTFFKFLARPKNEGGLELKNPAANLPIPEEGKGDCELLDPQTVFEKCTLSLEDKAIVGLAGYACCRLSEAAGLKWTDIDFTNNIVHVHTSDNEEGRQTEKTDASTRPIPMFGNLISILQEYKATCAHTSDNDFVFYEDSKKKTIYVKYRKGNSSSPKLGRIAKEIKSKIQLGKKSEPNMCLRHFYSTMFMQTPHSELESVVGAHSKAVSRNNYQNILALVKKAAKSMPTL